MTCISLSMVLSASIIFLPSAHCKAAWTGNTSTWQRGNWGPEKLLWTELGLEPCFLLFISLLTSLDPTTSEHSHYSFRSWEEAHESTGTSRTSGESLRCPLFICPSSIHPPAQPAFLLGHPLSIHQPLAELMTAASWTLRASEVGSWVLDWSGVFSCRYTAELLQKQSGE